MLRNNRTTLRVALIAVLLAGLAGAWFAAATWQVDVATLGLDTFSSEGDWVETLAALAEQAIEFVLGWTQ